MHASICSRKPIQQNTPNKVRFSGQGDFSICDILNIFNHFSFVSTHLAFDFEKLMFKNFNHAAVNFYSYDVKVKHILSFALHV